jgi:hypothetical protein
MSTKDMQLSLGRSYVRGSSIIGEKVSKLSKNVVEMANFNLGIAKDDIEDFLEVALEELTYKEILELDLKKKKKEKEK